MNAPTDRPLRTFTLKVTAESHRELAAWLRQAAYWAEANSTKLMAAPQGFVLQSANPPGSETRSTFGSLRVEPGT